MTGKTSGSAAYNRTGTQLVPERCEAMIAATEEFPPSSEGSAAEIARARVEYAKESEPPGTMPPSANVGQLAKVAVKTLRGRQPTAFLDKLGERLAFERSGTRLYEALVAKHEAYGGFPGGPTGADLQHVLDEERAHFAMLREVIASQGGDPTAVTPSANVHATASKGIAAVLLDPRTNLVEGLEVILIAELADNDGWDALIELTNGAGETDLAARFRDARDHEREHLSRVRGWLAAAQGRSLGERAPKASDESRSRPKRGAHRAAAHRTGRQRKTVGTRRRTTRKRARAATR
jgi:hypothetical protein